MTTKKTVDQEDRQGIEAELEQCDTQRHSVQTRWDELCRRGHEHTTGHRACHQPVGALNREAFQPLHLDEAMVDAADQRGKVKQARFIAIEADRAPRVRALRVLAALRLDAASDACERGPSASRTARTRQLVCV